MLGFRGCRLGLLFPEVTRMQCRAIFEAACQVKGERKQVMLEIMVPLVSISEELTQQAEMIHDVARQVTGEHGMKIEYAVGTMIELPRAALTAGKIAEHADFFSFGTNDLTQTTFGLSRDDSGRFLPAYVDRKILSDDPFQVLDREGVGELVRIGAERGRSVKPNLKGRHLRRARRRSQFDRFLQRDRIELCKLLALSRSRGAPGRGSREPGSESEGESTGRENARSQQRSRQRFIAQDPWYHPQV